MTDEVTEPQEAITPDKELDLEPSLDDTEDVEALRKQLEEKDTFARQAITRAKKAEDELKALKQPKDEPAPQTSSQPNVEEVVLLANGMPEELMAELKIIAQVRGTSLIKAQTDPIFVAVKEKFEKDQKQKEISLPASRGSGQVKPKVTLSTPNLPRDVHKELAQKALQG